MASFLLLRHIEQVLRYTMLLVVRIVLVLAAATVLEGAHPFYVVRRAGVLLPKVPEVPEILEVLEMPGLPEMEEEEVPDVPEDPEKALRELLKEAADRMRFQTLERELFKIIGKQLIEAPVKRSKLDQMARMAARGFGRRR